MGEWSVGSIGNTRIITNLADGLVNATSSDAINGAQLNAVVTEVTANTSSIATNTGNIVTIANSMMMYDSSTIAANQTQILSNQEQLIAHNNAININSASVGFNRSLIDKNKSDIFVTRQGITLALAAKPPTLSAADKCGRISISMGNFEGERAVSVGATFKLNASIWYLWENLE